MPRTQNRLVMYWIFTFTAFAAFLVVFGGFVRLTRSGLSIVEWKPLRGVLLPLDEQAWQQEFARYQQTPEFKQINYTMTLAQYKEIFIIEWLHRLLARLAGLIFAIPFFIFVFKGIIPWREAGLYTLMGLLFLAQATLGWIMVSSGLVERPSVSHYLLTAHLFLALALIGLGEWTALGHLYGFPDYTKKSRWSTASRWTVLALILLLIQNAYGGFTAGLKAGHISDTWPQMLGRLVPPGLLNQVQPVVLNLVAAPLTVAFIHRWFAFVALIAALFAYSFIRRRARPSAIAFGVGLVMASGVLQIALGMAVVLSHVQIALALLHQANAIVLFAAALYVLHRLRAADQSL